MGVSMMRDDRDNPDRGKPLLIGTVVILAVALGFLGWSAVRSQQRISAMETALERSLDGTHKEIAANSEQMDRKFRELREALESASSRGASPKQTAAPAGQQQPGANVSRLVKEQARLAAELGQIKARAASTEEKMSAMGGDVATAKSKLDETSEDIGDIRSDLGRHSGMIATNAKELEALKALGQRNYYEFQLTNSKDPVRVDKITVRLKKADPKRNRFTLTIAADDKVVEKKDRTVNEPILFYLSWSKQPYEIVINEVAKNRASGYLATPKTLQAAR